MGQVASGHDWKDKSVKPAIDLLLAHWFRVQPVSPAHPYMFIPFVVTDYLMRREIPRLGTIMHRLRIPPYASRAAELAARGIHVERIEEASTIQAWVDAYRHHACEECDR